MRIDVSHLLHNSGSSCNNIHMRLSGSWFKVNEHFESCIFSEVVNFLYERLITWFVTWESVTNKSYFNIWWHLSRILQWDYFLQTLPLHQFSWLPLDMLVNVIVIKPLDRLDHEQWTYSASAETQNCCQFHGIRVLKSQRLHHIIRAIDKNKVIFYFFCSKRQCCWKSEMEMEDTSWTI